MTQDPRAYPPGFPGVPNGPAAGGPVPGGQAAGVPRDTNPTDPRLSVEAGRYWAGAIATALVAALIGFIAVVVFERVFSLTLVPPPDLLGTGSHQITYAVDGALLALVTACLQHLLILSTPRPQAFFGWIMGLIIVVITVLPFAWTSDARAALLSGLVSLVIGVAVWSLLASVATRTIVRVA